MNQITDKLYKCSFEKCGLTFSNADAFHSHHRSHGQQKINLSSQSSQRNETASLGGKGIKQFEEFSIYHDVNLNPFDVEFRKASKNKASFKNHLSVPEVSANLNGSLETPRILPAAECDETISSTSIDDVHTCSSPTSLSSISTSSKTSLSTEDKICVSSSLQSSSILKSENEIEKREGRKKLTLNVSATDKNSSGAISTPTPVITAGPSASQSPLGLGNAVSPILNTSNILTANIPQITLNGTDLSDLNTPGLSPTLRLIASSPFSEHGSTGNRLSPVSFHESKLCPLNLRPQLEDVKSAVSPPIPAAKVEHSRPKALSSNDTNGKEVPQSPSATVLQMLLKLPDGRSIPVEIPATPILTSSTLTPPLSVDDPTVGTPHQLTAHNTSDFSSTDSNPAGLDLTQHKSNLAKMKLKEALASSQTAARPGSSRNSRAATADRIAEMTRLPEANVPLAQKHPQISEETKPKPEGQQNSSTSSERSPTRDPNGGGGKGGNRRRRSSNADEGPDEKRRKFLERNRVAAVRCRERKKLQVEMMKSKSETTSLLNQRLMAEVAALKCEVASLKSLLLKHKNCSVTMAIQAEQDAVENKAKMSVGQNQALIITNPPVGYRAQTLKTVCLAMSSEQPLTQVADNKPVTRGKPVTVTRKHSLPSLPLAASNPCSNPAFLGPTPPGTLAIAPDHRVSRVPESGVAPKILLPSPAVPSYPARTSTAPPAVVAWQSPADGSIVIRPPTDIHLEASSLNHNTDNAQRPSVSKVEIVPGPINVPSVSGSLQSTKIYIGIPPNLLHQKTSQQQPPNLLHQKTSQQQPPNLLQQKTSQQQPPNLPHQKNNLLQLPSALHSQPQKLSNPPQAQLHMMMGVSTTSTR